MWVFRWFFRWKLKIYYPLIPKIAHNFGISNLAVLMRVISKLLRSNNGALSSSTWTHWKIIFFINLAWSKLNASKELLKLKVKYSKKKWIIKFRFIVGFCRIRFPSFCCRIYVLPETAHSLLSLRFINPLRTKVRFRTLRVNTGSSFGFPWTSLSFSFFLTFNFLTLNR